MSRELSTFGSRLLDRRDFLNYSATGLGSLALATLLSEDKLLAGGAAPIRPTLRPEAPLAARPPHFAAKANRVLMIFCSGAVSHVDTFDYKPELVRRDGQAMPEAPITFQGEQGNLAQPRWRFRPRGRCGKMVSELLPHLAELADEMCFIHSMTARSNTHGPAENQMSTGFTLDGFPSAGAWVSYALGSECSDLPAFVAMPDPRGVPQVGPNNWGSGFLPAVFQGTAFSAQRPIPHLARPGAIGNDAERAGRDFLRLLNEQHLARHPGDTELSARIASYELAGRLQTAASAVADLSSEPAALLDRYGANDANRIKSGFARNCILARRLVERGVRFVQLFNGSYAMGEGVGNWDGHRTIVADYNRHGPILDQPCAALLRDLKDRGLLNETLVVWVTEFGRMPTFQRGAQGRDHNPHGFTVWLAGAGVKKGFSYGATDEFGHRAADDRCTVYDLHATILYLLGLQHERLSFYHNGIERRLTDVHGRVIEDILS
ncbi:MAG: DUF1501 domain-containing protein [Planctomycetes bacterium]|nr:DUF1501 domain-containing protein [Planctomycetota bacterium]